MCLLGCRTDGNPDSCVDTAPPEPVITWDTCANTPGEHACDFTLKDQNDNEFVLYDHVGKVIVLDFSTTWCYFCNVAATHTQEMQDMYGDDLVYATVLLQATDRTEPTLEDAEAWAEKYDITAPVLQGSIDMLGADPDKWSLSVVPTFFFINKDMCVYDSFNGWDKDVINTKINDLM